MHGLRTSDVQHHEQYLLRSNFTDIVLRSLIDAMQ